MKKLLFFAGICLLAWVPTSVRAANEQIYTGIFDRLHGGIDQITAERLAAVFQVEPEDILAFIFEGETATGALDIESVCRAKGQEPRPAATDAAVPAIGRFQKTDCLAELREFWQEERETVQLEFFTIQQSIGFSRWYDGKLESADDFDILTDLQVVSRQFFGTDGTLVSPPKADALVRQEFSLAESDFRLPMDALPFRSGGGCGAGQVSLYGGLICLPRFCTDILCVNVRPLPGRRAVTLTGRQREATVANAIADLEAVALRMYDSKQLTPTRNTNQGHWWSQMFNWDQLLRANLRMESRPVPILEAFVPSDPSAQTRKQYEYAYSAEGGFTLTEKSPAQSGGPAPAAGEPAEEPKPSEALSGEAAEQDKMKEKIRAELKKARNELGVCEGAAHCKSADILEILIRDCSLMVGRLTRGTTDGNLDACVRDFLKTAHIAPLDDILSKRLADLGQKQDFDKVMGDHLGHFSRQFKSLYQVLGGIDICTLRQAQNSCGTKKIRCTR